MYKILFLYFFRYFSMIVLICKVPNESKYQILFSKINNAMKCEPLSPTFDKFTITEKVSSSNVGILSSENVPQNDKLIIFIK